MIEFPADTPILGRRYCPGCEPAADPIAEILVVDWFGHHRPSDAGADDLATGPTAGLVGNTDSEGETNRAWCALVHGRAR